MSTAQPKLIQVDLTQPLVTGRKILAAGETQTLDSEYSCQLNNDTNTIYIVYTLHDNNWIAELWGQQPGQIMSMKPTWKVRIMTADGRDVLNDDNSGDESYNFCWSTTTQANSTFWFSKMSY